MPRARGLRRPRDREHRARAPVRRAHVPDDPLLDPPAEAPLGHGPPPPGRGTHPRHRLRLRPLSAYFAQTQSELSILGVDPNATRIEMARRVADHIGLAQNEYFAGDARDVKLDGKFAGAYVLDLMHHIPEADQIALLERLRDLLAPRGALSHQGDHDRARLRRGVHTPPRSRDGRL
ncbi:MAG: class I SAM-dependent methyltransferase [Labilithrix sp.]|nr:class I SAM-dependent methyltransferase [Labilithrix sp.]MCW5810317.1 class I SAM-dependent methyltransferase [Labilithrix sp.]